MGIYIELASIPMALIALGALALLLILIFKTSSNNKK
jgi:hypothetical protein